MNEPNTQLVQVAPIKLSKIADMKAWYNDFVTFSKSILKEDFDYGIIPGVNKPSLLKPGAEKLRLAYNLSSTIELTDKKEDIENGYLSYNYKCTVKTPGGMILAECEGNANSYETKFRYLWIKESELPKDIEKESLKIKESSITEFKFAIDKAETTGQYGKPKEYWEKWTKAIADGKAVKLMKKASSGKEFEAYQIEAKVYRVQNEDILGLQNTIMKMSQKRAFVGAVLMATGASEFFTQDVEDMELKIEEDLPITPVKPKVEEKKEEVTKPEEVKVEEGTVEEKADEIFTKATAPQVRIVEKFIEQGKVKKEDVNFTTLTMEEAKTIIVNAQK